MSCDIVRARDSHGRMTYKSQTPRGAEWLGKFLKGPWAMAEQVWVKPGNGTPLLFLATEAGLTVEDWKEPEPEAPKPVDIDRYLLQ